MLREKVIRNDMNDIPRPRRALQRTDRSLPIALLRAREAVMAPIREMLADAGVTEQQWRVLRVLEESGPLDSARAAEMSSLLAPSLSRIVQTLTAKGLVHRTSPESDRRRQMLEISPDGSALLARYRDEALRLARRNEERLGTERLELLLDLLAELQKP